MKIVVIPDVHQNLEFVKKILDNEKEYDKMIFLGDWFDNFEDIDSFIPTCEFLKELILLNDGRKVFLLGNHDLPYIYGNITPSVRNHYQCSGNTKEKFEMFSEEFFKKGFNDEFFLENFKVAHIEDGWTFSHAGILVEHIPYGKSVRNFVEDCCASAWKNFRNVSFNYNYILSDAGICRGGRSKVGGVLWLDWRNEFVAIPHGIGNQMFGHTTVETPEVVACSDSTVSVNLDARQSYYAIVQDNDFELVLVENL